MTQWNFKGNYLLCISFLLVADRFIYKLSKFAKSHSSLNILIVQMSDLFTRSSVFNRLLIFFIYITLRCNPIMFRW